MLFLGIFSEIKQALPLKRAQEYAGKSDTRALSQHSQTKLSKHLVPAI